MGYDGISTKYLAMDLLALGLPSHDVAISSTIQVNWCQAQSLPVPIHKGTGNRETDPVDQIGSAFRCHETLISDRKKHEKTVVHPNSKVRYVEFFWGNLVKRVFFPQRGVALNGGCTRSLRNWKQPHVISCKCATSVLEISLSKCPCLHFLEGDIPMIKHIWGCCWP